MLSRTRYTVHEPKSFAEKTSAADKSIGLDYQYYYFLNKLLNLKTGQAAGLEVEDDVHTTLDADINLLFQVKHTVQNAANGKPVALTELDPDLWKTLHNWANVIVDPAHGRTSVAEQLKFVTKTEFHLVSNKSTSKTNEFLRQLLLLNDDGCLFSDLRAYTLALQAKTGDTSIKGYIATVNSLNDKVLEQFFRKVHLELELVDVIGLVKRSIHEKAVDTNDVNAVFERLDSNIRSDNFLAIKQGLPLVVTYEQFMQRYRKIFSDARSKKLKTFAFTPPMPNDVFQQLFVKRLVEIGDLSTDDEELAIEYTTHKLRLAKFLQVWIDKGDIVPDEVEELHGEVFLRWRSEFRAAFKSCKDDSQVAQLAAAFLQILRRERFRLAGAEMGTALSNGELYILSDVGRIGWHRDWEKS